MNNSTSRFSIGAFLPGILFASLLAGCSGDQPEITEVSLPEWKGIWFAEGADTQISGFPSGGPASGGMNALVTPEAPWNEEGLVRLQEMFANMGQSKAKGWGYPMMMNGAAPLQFLVAPSETLIVNMYRDLRHVYTDGRALPDEADRWPTTWGESIGQWEGDTLVIETVSVREPTVFFFFTPPLSDEAHYVERLRMVSPDRIEGTMTITDPVTLTEPWTVPLAYVRTDGMDRLIHDDFTNDRSELDDNNVFSIETEAR